MDEEESPHEHVVEWGQRGGEPRARPRDGGGYQAKYCADQECNSLLEQRLASRHEAQAAPLNACKVGPTCVVFIIRLAAWQV
jgi:hypothetical protein